MNFSECLPTSHSHIVILVVADRFSKYAHLSSLAHVYTANDVAHLFMQTVFKLYGMLNSIVSDTDPIFMSLFLKELFKIVGNSVEAKSAYHA